MSSSAYEIHYRELRRRVIEAGLLDRSYTYYWLTITALMIVLAATGVILALWPVGGDVIAIFLLAIVMVQIGFLAHDAGHKAVFNSWAANRALGFVAFPLMLGISFENWVKKHNTHHARTNEVGVDPDIYHDILAFTPEQAAQRRGIFRWLVRNQAKLYFVLSMFATLAFRFDAWSHAIRNIKRKTTQWELAMIVVNLIVWFILPAILLGPVRWLIVFGVAQLILGVYMAAVFAPNHKGMPQLRGEKLSFIEQQVLTSRNVRGNWLVDFVYGGLNYQIEHHLFPTMPRNKLPRSKKVVASFCQEIGIPYREEGVIQSYRSLLGDLEDVGNGGQGQRLARS